MTTLWVAANGVGKKKHIGAGVPSAGPGTSRAGVPTAPGPTSRTGSTAHGNAIWQSPGPQPGPGPRSGPDARHGPG